MDKEELKKELEKLKDFKVYVFEWEIYVKAEDYKEMAIENKKLKDDIKKWEDVRMRKLAEIYNMPTKYLTTAIAKNEWFSSWYDTVKKKMLHELWFDRLDVQDLLKENKKLKKENEELKKENEELQEYKRMYEWLW